MRLQMNRSEKSWILYDVGNSAFVLIVVTVLMPIFFKEVVARDLAPAVSTAWWGYANALSSLFLVVLAPILGVFADYRGWKKKLFTCFFLTGVTATALLTLSGPGAWVYCLTIFIVARTGWAGANVFYDSFITDITEPARMDRVSTAGYAWGYIGSVAPFLAVIGLITGLGSGGSIPVLAARISFAIVAVWWLAFTLPLLRDVQQTHFCPPATHPVREAFKRLRSTFSDIRNHRNAFMFLLAYFFYIDGVDTIITMAVAYGVDLGLSSATLILAILVIQLVAFPCSLAWGRLSGHYSAKLLLQAGIAMYSLITLIAFLLPSLPTLQSKTAVFWTLSILVGTSMGGIQALSRSFFGRLIPAEQSAEFFGFYNIFGKFANIAGPLLVGAFGQLTGHSRYGVLSILVLFVMGSLILTRVQEHA